MSIMFMRRPQSYGGPGSFQTRLEKFLRGNNVQVSYYKGLFDLIKNPPDTVCVFSSTKNIFSLFVARVMNVRVVLRLDGKNWEHRLQGVSFLHYLYCELDNIVSIFIANFLCDAIIFQSKFVLSDWGKFIWNRKSKGFIIYNMAPVGSLGSVSERVERVGDLVVVEGEVKSQIAVEVLNRVTYPTHVYGRVGPDVRAQVINPVVQFMGVVERDSIPELLSRYKALLCLEVCPPCPNAVIEAVSVGTPVLAFATGSITELVHPWLNPVLNYGSRPEKYDVPRFDQFPLLEDFYMERFDQYAKIQAWALDAFGIDKIGSQYKEVLLGIQKDD